jgi:transposase InsO family protein
VIWELRHEHKVGLLIDIAGIPRSTYYYYSKQFENPKPDKYAEIKEEIRQIYNDSKGRYGYRRITKELQKTHKINHKTVQRLMRKMGIFCRVRMKKYNSFRGEAGRTAPNLLERNFKTDAPNQKWVTDVTEFSLFGTKLYLSPIIDLFNGEVVAYDLSYHPNLKQVTNMLEQAFAKIPDGTGLILHSDQGWQYQHKHYQKMLENKGVRQSMSRKGNCHDNSVMENFFGIMKQEMYYGNVYYSFDELKHAIENYIDYYNKKRIKQKLGWLSPVNYKLNLLAA